jgi:hypothetical protein
MNIELFEIETLEPRLEMQAIVFSNSESACDCEAEADCPAAQLLK